ncbi:BTAD domain-containing putative transcriptional regulator [Streptomyces sp. NPDC020983]|uniref:AfsR/SARP family transcriptional regulator n=1 Tax=Streptomyces sp. NPDC020983 TaxID=3365106 RepID=UPI00378D4BDF
MRFCVLGPLAVLDGDAWTAGDAERPLRGPLLRALLLVLLLRPNQPVTSEWLRDALWGGSPPASAAASLHNLVARLRSALAEGTTSRLRSTARGYLLDVAPGELDTEVFDACLGRAREARLAGRWDEVLSATTAALALWRGTPLADLPDHGEAYVPRQRLETARLEAVEWRFDAELALGRASGLVPELTRLAAEHPLHEAFHTQLIRALHHSGQRAEALAVYHRLRRALTDELGIEPGSAAQEAHRAVLARADTAATSAQSQPAPAQLPPPTAYFVGRDEHVKAALEVLTARRERASVVTVSGMAGVGKTALALHLAESLRDDFPDGQLFVSLHGATAGLAPLEPVRALTLLLRHLGVDASRTGDGPDAVAALLRSRLARSRTLLVLDDAASAAQVRPLLPAGPGCAALVTSRAALTTLDGLHIRLAPLSPAEGVALVERAAGGRKRSSAEEGPDPQGEALRLVELCGGLPLALRIATARLNSRSELPLARLVDQLAAADERLDRLELDDLSVRQSLAIAHDALRRSTRPLDVAAGRALALLGVVDLPAYSAPVMARLMNTTEARAGAALDRLVDVALLEETGRPGRYAPHDLVRDFARELAAAQIPPAARDRAASRALTLLLSAMTRTTKILYPTAYEQRKLAGYDDPASPIATTADALARGDEEADNLDAFVRYPWTDAADTTRALALVRAAFIYLRFRARYEEMGRLNEFAAALARDAGDLVAEAWALDDLAGQHFETGQFDAAMPLRERAHALWLQVGDEPMALAALNKRAVLLEQSGRLDEAVEVLNETLRACAAAGNVHEEACALSNLGNVYQRTDPRQALRYHRRSIEVGRGSAVAAQIEYVGEANIGDAHLALGEPSAALEHYERCLELAGGKGVWNTEREARIGLIRALRALGHTDRAEAECRTLLTAARTDSYGRGLAHHQLGLVLHERGDAQGAHLHRRTALDLLDGTGASVLPELRSLLGEPPAQGR